MRLFFSSPTLISLSFHVHIYTCIHTLFLSTCRNCFPRFNNVEWLETDKNSEYKILDEDDSI